MKGVSWKSLDLFSSLKWRFLNMGECESKSLILAARLATDCYSCAERALSLAKRLLKLDCLQLY